MTATLGPARPVRTAWTARCAALLALALGPVAPTAAADQAAPPPTPPEMWVVVDPGALGGGMQRPPLSAWSTPSGLAARAHVASQVSLLSHGAIAAGAELAAGFHGGSFAVLPATPDDPDRLHARAAALIRADWAEQLAKGFTHGADIDAGGVHGKYANLLFVGANDGLLALGDPTAIVSAAALEAQVASAHPAAPLIANVDFAAVFALMRQLEAVGVSYNLDPLLPRWRVQAPKMTISAAPGSGGWDGTLAFQADALPLHALDPAFAKLCVERQLRLALGVEPRVLAQILDNFLPLPDQRAVETILGMSVDRASGALSGDLVLVADAKGLLPSGALAMGLKPGGLGTLLAGKLAQALAGTPLPDQGAAPMAWTLPTQLGALRLEVSATALVLGNDDELVHALAAGSAPAPAPAAAVPAGVCGFAACDLPALSSQWLPALWPLLRSLREPLAEDPLGDLSRELPLAASFLIQAQGPQASWAVLAADPLPTLNVAYQGRALAWIPSTTLRASLRALGGVNGATDLEHQLSAYADARLHPTTVVAVVARLPDGLHLVADARHGASGPLSAEAVTARLVGLDHVLGPEPSDLVACTPTPEPELDAAWLPDATAFAQTLAPYRLEVRATKAGATAVEHGEPLGCAAALAASYYLMALQQPRMLIYQQRFSGAQPPPAPGRKTVEF
jgi:hypothetical protein